MPFIGFFMPDLSDSNSLIPEEEIQDYFTSNFDPDDIPSLWNLKQKSSLLNAFATIFRGEPTGVLVRIHVLSEMSIRPAETPFWELSELRYQFAYLTETAFETVIRRLRGGGLIGYDRERNSYSMTPLGLEVSGTLSHFLRAHEEEGFGLLTSILYGDEAIGHISKEELAHLLSRLGQVEEELMSAVDSASEPEIIKARERFETVWKRIQQGTDVIRRIAKNRDMGREIHRLGQRVASAQSRLARVTSIFQRAINDIDRQRMHLGSSGISTSDINRYLMNRTIDEIVPLLEGAMGISAQPALLLTDLLGDVAEYELVDKERERKEAWNLPELVNADEEEVPEKAIPYFDELVKDITNLGDDPFSLRDVIPKMDYEVSSYRLSMLSLTKNVLHSKRENPLPQPDDLSVSMETEEGEEEVMKYGVLAISKGAIKRSRRDNHE